MWRRLRAIYRIQRFLLGESCARHVTSKSSAPEAGFGMEKERPLWPPSEHGPSWAIKARPGLRFSTHALPPVQNSTDAADAFKSILQQTFT